MSTPPTGVVTPKPLLPSSAVSDAARRAFRRNLRQLQAGRAVTQVLGVVIAGVYSGLTLALPLRVLPVVAALLVVSLGVVALLFRTRIAASVSRLGYLVDPAVTPTVEQLQEAVRHARGVPDGVFRTSLTQWLVSSFAMGIGLAGVGRWLEIPWASGLRLALIGALLGPPVSAFAHAVAVLRAREVIRSLGEMGLTPALVIDALPQRPSELTRRLRAYLAFALVLPGVMVADLASTVARQSEAQLLGLADPAARQARAAQLELKVEVATVGFGLLLLGFTVMSALAAGSALGQPLQEIAAGARQITEGRAVIPRTIPAEEEIWAISAAFATMQGQLAEVLGRLKRAGLQIDSTATQVVSTTGEYQERASEQASALEETSATTEELARSAQQISESAAQVAEIARQTFDAAQAGQQGAQEFSHSMELMIAGDQEIEAAVRRLDRRVREIARTVALITQVADKTELLALSAELEGIKAGEIGVGFSSVAAEVRRLAENMIGSTREIERLIEDVGAATQAALVATGGGVKATRTGTALASQVSARLDAIVELSGQTADAVRNIMFASRQQQSGTDQLVSAMNEILRITHESLGATTEVATANLELASLTWDLKRVVERFDLTGEAAEAAAVARLLRTTR